jgi:fibronectin type III domain protein
VRAHRVVGFVVLLVVASAAAPAVAANVTRDDREPSRQPSVVELKDARLKFEINATDEDGGVQAFIDADPWTTMSIYDPHGRRIFTATATGQLGRQGGTELFLESGEPPFSELPLDDLLRRWPAGEYEFRGQGPDGVRYEGEAQLTHDLPDGPTLVSPLDGGPPQDPNATTLTWEPVDPPNGSPIVGYQVLVVQPDTGLVALPKITLDVMMPPTATSMVVPSGFLQPNTEYEWEVLAIEQSGNQTLSSSFFTTAP